MPRSRSAVSSPAAGGACSWRLSDRCRLHAPLAVEGSGETMLSLESVMTLIGAAGIAGIVAWIARPLYSGAITVPPADPRAVALLTRREGILVTLRDLDSDFAAGRLGADDYSALRQVAVAKGVAVLAALDGLAAESNAAAADLTREVEADVLARRAATVADAPSTGAAADLPPVPPDRLSGGLGDAPAAPPGRACPECGRATGVDDDFCARCGTRLTGEGAAAT